MRVNRIIVLIVATTFLFGCFKKKFLILNPQFSVNLALPTEDWPEESKLTPAQKAVFKQFGKPDFIRIWWDNEGRIKSYLNVDRAIDKKLYRKTKKSWVFRRIEKEIVFVNENNYSVVLLVRVVVQKDPLQLHVHDLYMWRQIDPQRGLTQATVPLHHLSQRDLTVPLLVLQSSLFLTSLLCTIFVSS